MYFVCIETLRKHTNNPREYISDAPFTDGTFDDDRKWKKIMENQMYVRVKKTPQESSFFVSVLCDRGVPKHSMFCALV